MPVWRAHRWIRQMCGSIVMNGAVVVQRQRPAMNGQSAADRMTLICQLSPGLPHMGSAITGNPLSTGPSRAMDDQKRSQQEGAR